MEKSYKMQQREFQLMHILYLLGMNFDAAVVFVTKCLLLFRLALTIPFDSKCQLTKVWRLIDIEIEGRNFTVLGFWQTVVRKYAHNQSRSSRLKHLLLLLR